MQLPLTNSIYRFSYYKNLYSSGAPDGEMNINDIIEIVKYGYLKEEINQLRLLTGEEYNTEKRNYLTENQKQDFTGGSTANGCAMDR